MKTTLGIFCCLLLNCSPAFGFTTPGGNIFQTDGTAGDTQAAINAAPDGATVRIPAGSFTWSSAVSVAGRGIKLEGAGSGRIIGRSTDSVAIGTGGKTFTTQSGLSIVNGQTLRIWRTADPASYMEGTVVSYNGISLQMNITASGGGGTGNRWVISTNSATTITHSAGSSQLVSVTEDATHSVEMSGLRFIHGGGNGEFLDLHRGAGVKPILIHDCWFSLRGGGGIRAQTNRGIVWDCSFDSAPFSMAGLGIQYKAEGQTTSWTTASTMGAADTTGTNNFYVENCDFHAFLNCVDFDDNSRTVMRHCLFNNAGLATHGADTSNYGNRHFEVYDSEFVFNGYNNGSTFNLNWWFFIRGGTFIVTDCIMPDINSTDYGNKPEFNMTVMNLQRSGGPNPCWGGGYPAPRQAGFGRITGTAGNDSITYKGDSEPIHIWNITGTTGVGITNFGGGGCSTSESSVNYIVSGRDYFVGTPKPGYTKYVYPHPMRNAAPPPNNPEISANPQSLTCAAGQVATFGVTATGAAPLAFQWQKNQINIVGATSSSYTIASVQAADAGNFRCVVSNSYGSATSAAATLTFDPTPPTAPAITGNPQALSRSVGQSATFNVTATGTAPLTYQWQKNQGNIVGANSAGLTIGGLQAGDAGNYRCVVSNGLGSAISSEAALTVSAPPPTAPAITSQPQSLTRTVGLSATFSVTATGTAPLSYQWQKGTFIITGATGASYTIPSVVTGDAGNYRCVVTNSVGSSTSSDAGLTVSPAALAGIYYVDESVGSDSNPGTAASPWRRCPGMVGWTGSATLQPGDAVYFNRTGTWSLGQNLNGPGLDLKRGVHYVGNEWSPSGGSSGRAVLRATARHETGVVRFWEDHPSIPTWFQGFEVDANNQRTNLIDINHAFWRTGLTNAAKRIEDCVAHGNTGDGSQGDYKYGIIVSDNSPDSSGQVANVEILNTVVYDVARDGICLYPGSNGMVSNILVRGCEVYNTDRDPSYFEGHGIVMKGNVKNSVIEYCYSHNVNSSAIFVNGPESGSGPGPSNCVVRYNILQTADNNGVIRFFGTGSKSVDIIGNIVLPNEATGGLSFSGNSGTIATRIYNNTFYNSFVDIGNPTSTGTIDFRNNIIYELDDAPLTDSGSDLTTHSNNLLFRVGGGLLASVGGANYSSANIGSWEPTARTSDPLFKNAAGLPNGFSGIFGSGLAPNNDGLSLQTGSVALNAGADLGVGFNGSINSRLRPVDGVWDIGAFEGLGSGLLSAPTGLRVVGQ